jgi:hypothetical protein
LLFVSNVRTSYPLFRDVFFVVVLWLSRQEYKVLLVLKENGDYEPNLGQNH